MVLVHWKLKMLLEILQINFYSYLSKNPRNIRRKRRLRNCGLINECLELTDSLKKLDESVNCGFEDQIEIPLSPQDYYC